MPNWVVGKTVKINSPKGEFEVKEVIEKPDLNLTWDWDRGICPHCNKAIKNTKTYKLERIFVLEDKNGNRPMFGETESVTTDGKPLLMRLPDKEFHLDKDMTTSVKDKSDYLKGAKNGN